MMSVGEIKTQGHLLFAKLIFIICTLICLIVFGGKVAILNPYIQRARERVSSR